MKIFGQLEETWRKAHTQGKHACCTQKGPQSDLRVAMSSFHLHNKTYSLLVIFAGIPDRGFKTALWLVNFCLLFYILHGFSLPCDIPSRNETNKQKKTLFAGIPLSRKKKKMQSNCIRSESLPPHRSEVRALVLTGYLHLARVVRKTTITLQGPKRTTRTHAHNYRH